MTSLIALQAQGGGRIPTGNGLSYNVSRSDLAALIAAMPNEACRAMHIAARRGDTETAQRLIREAAVQYFTSTPTTPAAAPPMPRRPARRPKPRRRHI